MATASISKAAALEKQIAAKLEKRAAELLEKGDIEGAVALVMRSL